MATYPNRYKTSSDTNNWMLVSAALLIIVLMITVALISLSGMESIRDRAEILVSNQHEKMELVVKMRAAARERTVILQRLILLDDPFVRDEEYMRFNKSGSDFATARLSYIQTELSEKEKILLGEQGALSKTAVGVQAEVADLATQGELEMARILLTNKAKPVQDQVLATLNHLYDLNYQNSRSMVQEATEGYHNARLWLLIATIVAISIVIVLGVLIFIRSSHLNKERESNISEINRANKAKSAFLANMSHEIRTPLTAIIGFAEASLDSGQSMKERLSALKTIVRSGKHLLQVINDILDLSKIEADKLEVEKVEVPLFQLMSDVESVASMQATDKSLSFNINYDFPVPETIVTDPLRLKQVLFNLLSNAFKFTESGHVNIQVGYDKDSHVVKFSVIDSGTGISKQQLANVFKAFTQEDAGTSRKFGGTGLGLSISKLLVEKLGGTIDVQSTKGVGSNFTITVLSDNCDSTRLINSAAEAPSYLIEEQVIFTNNENKLLSGTILLAEDNPDNQKLIAMHLKKMGASVQIVGNGKLALEEALKTQYDLIFMDMQMPVLDGVEAVKLLRKENYEGPVVALTANAMKEDRNKCLDAGCNDFITKPINKEQLYTVTARYLETIESPANELEPIHSALLNEDPSYIELVNQFVKNLPERIDALICAHNNNDLPEIRKIVHDLKGLGGGYGYNQLSDLASKMMFLIEDNNFNSIPVLLIELEDMCKRIYRGAQQQDLENNSPSVVRLYK